MTPYRLVIAPKFAADLTAIHDRVAKDSPANAAAVAGQIMDALEPLKMVPHRAPIEPQPPGLRHPVRSVAVPPYIVYFRAVDASQVGARAPRPTRGSTTADAVRLSGGVRRDAFAVLAARSPRNYSHPVILPRLEVARYR